MKPLVFVSIRSNRRVDGDDPPHHDEYSLPPHNRETARGKSLLIFATTSCSARLACSARSHSALVGINRGEPVNALWIVIAAVCVYLIAYRFYSLFISRRVMQSRPRHASGPSQRRPRLRSDQQVRAVRPSFRGDRGRGAAGGSGAGRADGLSAGHAVDSAGVVFAGAVQDLMVLFVSTRRDGRSLGDLIRSEMARCRA